MEWTQIRTLLTLAERFPHTFTIQYPPSREFFRAHFRAALPQNPVEELLEKQRELLLYVHVPFCEAKCYYCNFAVDLRRDAELHRRYVTALCAQLAALDRALPASISIAGIDIGGGTPTLLSESLLDELLRALRPFVARTRRPWPLSIETTPRVAAQQPSKLALLRQGGVGRVSVGLQSTNDETLVAVNREAQRTLADRATENLLRTGFDRVNVDLVFGLPGQTVAHFRQDIAQVGSLGVDSITTYDCLFRGAGRATRHVHAERPSSEQLGIFYDLAYEGLRQRGYATQYGSLNFCRHAGETGTSAYFEGRLLDGLPYVGIGNYAASMAGPYWWFAPYGVNAYLDAVSAGVLAPVGDCYQLPDEERMAKALLLSLSFGVLDGRRFARQFNVILDEKFAPQLEYAMAQRWLSHDPQNQVYTVYTGAFAHMAKLRALFYSPAAAAWLHAQQEPAPARKLAVLLS